MNVQRHQGRAEYRRSLFNSSLDYRPTHTYIIRGFSHISTSRISFRLTPMKNVQAIHGFFTTISAVFSFPLSQFYRQVLEQFWLRVKRKVTSIILYYLYLYFSFWWQQIYGETLLNFSSCSPLYTLYTHQQIRCLPQHAHPLFNRSAADYSQVHF